MTIEKIINKYLNKETLSEEEASNLNRWRNERSENNRFIRRIQSLKTDMEISRRLEKEASGTFFTTWRKLKSRKHNAKRTLWLGASVAAILLVFAISSLVLMNRDFGPDNFQGNTKPGSNQAILKLADGSQVKLSPEVSDVVKKEGVIINIDKGKVSYKETHGVDSILYNTIVIPRKGEYKIVLSDGSAIWLNAESKLKYPQKFIGKERRVFLTGEAYFEVTHDKNKPFIVETEAQELTVLGTKFNISAFNDESAVLSTLVSGSVKINVKNTDLQVLLIPGQQAIVDKKSQTLNVASVDVTEVTAWKEGFFSLENVTMEEFLHKLSRWYDVEFVFGDDDVKKLSFKGSIPRYDDLISVLDILQIISPVEFNYQKDKIEAKMKK